MSRHRPFRLCLAIVAACLGLAGTAHAAIDLPASVAMTDSASTVDVFLVPPMMIFRASLDEAQMQMQACRYATSDPAAIRAMAALFKAAAVAASMVYQRPDIREGVYFTMADGSQLKLLLQDNNGGRAPVTGVAGTTRGSDLQTVGVTARPTLATDLRQWASTHGGAGAGAACNRRMDVPTGLPQRGPGSR